MIRKTKLFRDVFILFVILAFFISCDGLTSNNSSDEEIVVTEGMGGVSLAIQGTPPASSSAGVRAVADPVVLPVNDLSGTEIGTVTLTEARVNLYQIELDQDDSEVDTPEEEEQANSETEYTGPFVIDILNGTSDPELPYVELLPGTYNEIKLKLAKVEEGQLDSSDPLFGNSIYLEGTYSGPYAAGTAVDMPIYISIDDDTEFELTGTDTSEGFVIDEGVVNEIIIAARMVKWFAFNNSETNSNSVLFSNAVSSDSTTIVLDSTENTTIYEVVLKNIKESADYGEDDDGDGYLESDEDDDPDTEDANDS